MPDARSAKRRQIALVVGVYLLLAGFLVLRLRNRVGPFVFADEAAYGKLAQNLGFGNGLTYEGMALTQYKTFYPFLVAPFWSIFDLHGAYRAALTFNGLAMSAAYFPAWWIARRVTTAGWAVVAAAATVLIPAMVWSGMLMTEATAYPAAALALALIVAAIDAPSRRRSLLAVTACAVAAVSRSELIVLFGVHLAAIGADALRHTDRRARLREHRDALWAYAAGFVLAVGLFATGHRELVLGTYKDEVTRGFSVGDLLGYLPRYVGLLVVATLILPPLAMALLALRRESWREHALGSVLIVALAASGALLLLGAWSTATISPELRERYVFYAMPAVAACWPAMIGRVTGARPLLIGGGLLALYLAPVWPRIAGNSGDEWAQYSLGAALDRFFGAGGILDGRTGIHFVVPLLSHSGIQLTALCAVGLALLAAWALQRGVPSSRWTLAAFGVPTLLVGFTMLQVREIDAENVARSVRGGYPDPPGFIDGLVHGDAAFVRTAGSDSRDVWYLELWNKRLTRQWRIEPGTVQYNGIGQACILFVRNGRLIPRERECAGQPLSRYLVFKDESAEVGLRNGRLLFAGDGGTRLYEAPADEPPELFVHPHA